MTPTQPEQFLCLHCRKSVTPQERPRRTFLGFQEFICPLCKLESKYPLTLGYTAVYCILLAGNAFYWLYAISQSRVTPNLWGIAILIFAAISLVESARRKRDVSAVMNAPDGEQPTDFRSYKRLMIAKDRAYASMTDRDLQSGYESWLAVQQMRANQRLSP